VCVWITTDKHTDRRRSNRTYGASSRNTRERAPIQRSGSCADANYSVVSTNTGESLRIDGERVSYWRLWRPDYGLTAGACPTHHKMVVERMNSFQHNHCATTQSPTNCAESNYSAVSTNTGEAPRINGESVSCRRLVRTGYGFADGACPTHHKLVVERMNSWPSDTAGVAWHSSSSRFWATISNSSPDFNTNIWPLSSKQ